MQQNEPPLPDIARAPQPDPRALPADWDWSRAAVFLDFDGTLAPLCDWPDQVALPDAARALLGALLRRTGGAVAILTGRALADIAAQTRGLDLVLAGSHGLELRRPGDAPAAVIPAPALDTAFAALAAVARADDLLIERKPGAVALHYRGRPDLRDRCRDAVDAATRDDPMLRAIHGDMVSEAALRGIDKGTALQALMAEPPFQGRRPLMAGDDRTDEDGIRAAQALGGIGLHVGDKPSQARLRCTDQADFLAWLIREIGEN